MMRGEGVGVEGCDGEGVGVEGYDDEGEGWELRGVMVRVRGWELRGVMVRGWELRVWRGEGVEVEGMMQSSR